MHQPLPLPIIPERPAKTWLPRIEPPPGEWEDHELVDGSHKSWTLRLHPVFEARITGGAKGTYVLEINGKVFGQGLNVEGLKQRAEREIASAVRRMTPAYRIVAKRVRSTPTLPDPKPLPPVVVRPEHPERRPLHPKCACGAEAKWGCQTRWDTFYYCGSCLPPGENPAIEPAREAAVCNLYSVTSSQTAIRQLVRAIRDVTGNLPPLPRVFPDQTAPVVRVGPDGARELVLMRWGFPQPPLREGEKPRPGYVTNVRNTRSPWWEPWLQPEYRCLVPVNSFCEPDNRSGKCVWTWFARNESRPLFFFAGIWRPWSGRRGTKAAPVEGDHLLFSFLTTAPNEMVGAVHEKAMPVLLLDEDARETWMKAPVREALALQRPAPESAVQVVARGEKEDRPK